MLTGFRGMVVALQKVCASGSKVKLLRSSGMPTQLSLGSLSLVLDLTIKKGVGLPCTNWSGAGATLLMSPRQGETSQHRGMKCGMAGWVSRKCISEITARATLLRQRVGPCQLALFFVGQKWYFLCIGR